MISGELFIIIGAFRAGYYIEVGIFILSICVIFAGFARHVMKISFSDAGPGKQIEEKAAMFLPQYALLITSLLLCFWTPGTLYSTIINAVATIGGGF